MAVDLPPHYAVRDYLKQQGLKFQALTSASFERLVLGWSAAYSKKAVSSDTLQRLAEEYSAKMEEAGAFGLTTSHVAPSKALPSRENFSVSGFMLEPVGLSQGLLGADATPYVEKAALLRTTSAKFQRKRASLGVGMGCVALTEHLLQRVYERTEVSRDAFRQLLEDELFDLIRALILADAAGLWIERVEAGGMCRVTAVPYSNGLMIANERILFGDIEEGDFGFRFEIPRFEMHTPFVNSSRIIDDLGDGRFLRGNTRPVTITCGVTYLHSLSLDRDESDYFYGFRALIEQIGNDSLDLLARLTLTPLYAHQQPGRYLVNDAYLPKTARLAALLNAGWLKPKLTRPLCVLLPYDQIPARRIA